MRRLIRHRLPHLNDVPQPFKQVLRLMEVSPLVNPQFDSRGARPGVPVTQTSASAIRTISFAISSGDRTKSMHSLAIALSGISG